MPAPILSFEVVDMILGFVKDPDDDDADLLTCALVHPAWTRPSQARLLRSVEIKLGRQWSRLWAALQGSPHLRALMQTLHIRDKALDGVSVPIHQVPVIFPSVMDIRMVGVGTQNVLKLLTAFPALKTLSLCYIDVDFPADELKSISLESLDISWIYRHQERGTALRGALTFLASSMTTCTLRMLHLDVPELDDYSLLRVSLNALTSLEELKMRVYARPLAIIGYDLGEIHVTILKLDVFWIYSATVKSVFLLLKHTSFPRMVELRLWIRESHHNRRLGRAKGTFYFPFGREWNGKSGPEPREWELTPVFARRLKRVRVELHYLIPCLFQAQAFFRLFGAANSPRVLDFVPNGAKVVD